MARISVMICSKCNSWYKKSGSVQGVCRCKESENWNKDTFYSSTCAHVTPIKMPVFFEAVAKCKV